MMRRKYRYFISYLFQGGHGCCEYILERKMVSFSQIVEIKSYIEKRNEPPRPEGRGIRPHCE
jgi:hypothetical protein